MGVSIPRVFVVWPQKQVQGGQHIDPDGPVRIAPSRKTGDRDPQHHTHGPLSRLCGLSREFMLARRDYSYLHQHPIPDSRKLALKHRRIKAIK